MTDNTQPEAMGLADWLEAVGGGPSAKRCAALLREQHTRIAELEAQIEALSGVQALSAAPEAIAKLRHLYQNMVNGAVRDTASAKRIAEGLLAPAIEALERATPPAEQAAPKAEPGERFDSEGFRAWVRKNLPDDTIIGSSAWWADHLTTWAQRFVKAAPRQEAQEPVAWLNPWRADKVTTDYDAYGERGIPLYTAPQPAPAPLTDAQIKELIEDGVFLGNCKEIVRAIERAHGIKQGGQHE